jgi:hypothetical protein
VAPSVAPAAGVPSAMGSPKKLSGCLVRLPNVLSVEQVD